MLESLRARLSFANVTAAIALFVALGGGAYAVSIPNHSVGTNELKKKAVKSKQLGNGAVNRSKLKDDAVNTAKVQNASLLAEDFAPGQLPAGQTGPAGPEGPPGASALDPVPSGETIRGAIGADDHAHDADASDFGIDVTMPMPAANPLSDNDVFVNVAGWQNAGGQTAPTTTDTNPGCSGTPSAPTAAPGDVCIYVAGADHAVNLEGFSVLFGTEASPFGFKLKWDASQEGDTFVDATWAYTAP